jgi:hypothetical protein
VMRLMGAVRRQEMLVSFLAGQLAPCLGTVQREPVVVGARGSGEFLSFEGRVLPALNPTGLRDVLSSPAGPLTTLQELRDRDLNRLNALMKQGATNTQRAFLDRLVRSQQEARTISQQLLDNLSGITANDLAGQVAAAATLIRMNVTPVVSLHIGFGGDNHNDADLAAETRETVAGVGAIGLLMQKLNELGLQDQVTFAAMNVFGRTLSKKGIRGRDHLANHHVTVMIGKGIRPGVIGALAPKAGDFAALPINAATGAADPGGDIKFEETLGAMGQTLAAAVGVSPAAMSESIMLGKPVAAALVG